MSSKKSTPAQATKGQWRCNTPNLIEEIMTKNHVGSVLSKPVTIFAGMLEELADIARDINHPELNAMMMRLALYVEGDPTKPGYDSDFYAQIVQLGAEAREERLKRQKNQKINPNRK